MISAAGQIRIDMKKGKEGSEKEREVHLQYHHLRYFAKGATN